MSDPSYSTKADADAGLPATPEAAGTPARLGGYRIVKQLGQGGMGIVFRAEDEQLRRPVALKVMRADIAAHEDARARFLREARAAAALKHDHIVTIYQVGEDQGMPFLAMEFLQGKSLEDWLRPDRRATVPEALAIGKQIAKGLAAAHAVGLIHRDIKPANLWLEAPRGRVKILDFGLARLMAGELTALTQDGTVLGTPAFMAPEQARGEKVDPRCDLFSLGCVLYRTLGGQLPFQGNSTFAVLSAIASETPMPLRDLNPNVPSKLANLIDRLLAKKPEGRPPSAQAVLDELNAVEKEIKQQSATPTIAMETVPARTIGKLPLWLLPALGGGVLLTALVIVIIAVGNRPAEKSKGDSQIPAVPPKVQAGPIDLLALVDVKRENTRGVWTLKDGRLVGTSAKKGDATHLVLPWDPPLEYRLKFTLTRLSPLSGNAAIGIGSGAARPIIYFDSSYKYKKEKNVYSGLAFIDGKGLSERPDAKVGVVLPPFKPVAVAVTVKSNQVLVEVDGIVITDRKGDLYRTGRNPGAPSPPLLLGGFDGSFEFKDVILEPLGADAGKPMPR